MALRPCIVHRCTEYAADGLSRCERHQRDWERSRWDRGATGARGSRTGWRALRLRVWSRQKRQCADCGKRPQRFYVHHVDGNARNDSLENLVGLCERCHRNRHRKDSR